MPTDDSQAPDTLDIKQLFERLSQQIPETVDHACYNYCRDTNRAEIVDLSQEIRLSLFKDDYKKLRSFDNRSSPETWLFVVVKRHVLRYLQKQQKQKTVSLEDMPPGSLKCEPTQERTLISEGERKAFWAFVRNLSPRKRQFIELALQGLKPDEVAEVLGIKPHSVHRNRHELKKELRKFVEERGLALPDGSLEEILEIFFR